MCRKPIILASCPGRIQYGFVPTLRGLPRSFANAPCIRLNIHKDFVSCRVAISLVKFGKPLSREPGWQLRALQNGLGEQSPDAGASGNLQSFYATCEKGLEQILAAELSSPLINASQVETDSGGVFFRGTQSTGYNANLWLRTGDRVLCELARCLLPQGKSRFDLLYEFVREAADWPLLLVDDSAPLARTLQSETAERLPNRYKFKKFIVQIRLSNWKSTKDQNYVSASVSNAIWDALRDSCVGQWPAPAEREDLTAVPLFLDVNEDTAFLYRDMSGVSLHRRGYRDVIDKTKPNEGLAAAILTLAGWNHNVHGFGAANKNDSGKDRVLLDPFCGTGTILIEAALMAYEIAPGLFRPHWPFQTWHDYDPRAWTECRDAAASVQALPVSGARLIGNDMNDGAITRCKRAARAAGVLHLLELSSETSRHYKPPVIPSLVVTNPSCSAPLTYSSLRGEDERLLTLWLGFGQLLKSQCRGADVYVLSENDWLAHAMHMVPDSKWDLQPNKQWRGNHTGRKTDKIFGSQERKLLHFHVQSRYARGDPLTKIPFSSLSPKTPML